MATGGPEPGPSESSRSCDLSLQGFTEQPWSVFAAALGRDHPISDDKTKTISRSYVHRFDSDYMGVFGFFPDRENFLTVVCDECNKILIPHRVKQHVLTYHSNSAKRDSTTKTIHTSQADVIEKHGKHEQTSSKAVKYNPDIHCGVTTGEDSKPCMRSLRCKTHSSWMRRSVLGRSKPFNKLLAELSQILFLGKDKPSSSSHTVSSNNVGEQANAGTKSDNTPFGFKIELVSKSNTKSHDVHSDSISKINASSNTKSGGSTHLTTNTNSSGQKNLTSQSARSIQEPVKTIIISGNTKNSETQSRGSHSSSSKTVSSTSKISGIVSESYLKNNSAASSSTASVSASSNSQSVLNTNISSHKVTSQSVKSSQESMKSTAPVKLVKSGFSLPLTFPLSCISDLSLLKHPISILKSSVAATATTSGATTNSSSISKKQTPIVSTAAVTSTTTVNHVKPCVSTINAMTNTAVNTAHLRNSNHVYINVLSVDSEQSIPKPSAICTFNSRKVRNQLIFTPKVIAYNDAFDPVPVPVPSYFNHIPNQPHSRPPLVSNYNLTNSMNGPSLHMSHSLNGYNHNPHIMRMPSSPVSSLKPVMIGGKPTTYKPLLPKCPPIRAHTPHSFQYQNGYTNGVCSPPASLATTSLKRLNPYNVMNNTDEAKQSRPSMTTPFVIDEDDDLPNGKTDLTTLMELEFDEP